jgi:hypothetical protein
MKIKNAIASVLLGTALLVGAHLSQASASNLISAATLMDVAAHPAVRGP